MCIVMLGMQLRLSAGGVDVVRGNREPAGRVGNFMEDVIQGVGAFVALGKAGGHVGCCGVGCMAGWGWNVLLRVCEEQHTHSASMIEYHERNLYHDKYRNYYR